jgi:hypothetical protein
MSREVKGMKARTEHIRSSGNVFADLELPDADERMLKAQLTVQKGRAAHLQMLTNSLIDLCGMTLYPTKDS